MLDKQNNVTMIKTAANHEYASEICLSHHFVEQIPTKFTFAKMFKNEDFSEF